MEVLVDLMEDEEVEEVIDIEYEVLGLAHSSAFQPFRLRRMLWLQELMEAKLRVKLLGVGRAILRKCLEIAKSMGYNGVWLETPVDGPVEFYTKEGFRIYGLIEDCYGNGIHGFKLVYVFC
ncbi:MAG: hypothetical protein DRO98_06765 [Archaeoglobales archaeon]|nr:MAG: hypothetical protein DRO98_06765 [Archaeoglobales archaeon]